MQMKKISTLYKKDPNDLGRVINEINPENEWVFKSGIPTRKFDGTSCAIIDGELYKRFDLKKGRDLPPNAIPCQEPDSKSGHHPHWIKCERNDNSNKWHFVAFDALENNDLNTVADIALIYYDRAYNKGLSKRDSKIWLEIIRLL